LTRPTLLSFLLFCFDSLIFCSALGVRGRSYPRCFFFPWISPPLFFFLPVVPSRFVLFFSFYPPAFYLESLSAGLCFSNSSTFRSYIDGADLHPAVFFLLTSPSSFLRHFSGLYEPNFILAVLFMTHAYFSDTTPAIVLRALLPGTYFPPFFLLPPCSSLVLLLPLSFSATPTFPPVTYALPCPITREVFPVSQCFPHFPDSLAKEICQTSVPSLTAFGSCLSWSLRQRHLYKGKMRLSSYLTFSSFPPS